MTAPDPRLGEIEARLSKATPGPWDYEPFDESFGIYALEQRDNGDFPAVLGYYSSEGEGGTEADAEFIAHAPADVAYLLAELRKAQEGLGRVEAIEQRLERSMQGEDREIAEDLRAAVAAATGGERG